MNYELIFNVFIVGFLASMAYTVGVSYEGSRLEDIPSERRPKWIPSFKFQLWLGHFATANAVAYMVMYVFAEKNKIPGAGLVLMLAIWFVLQAVKRFMNASSIGKKSEGKPSRP